MPPDDQEAAPANARTADSSTAPVQHPANLWSLFLAFNSLALQGFGGVLAVAQRVLVEQRRWLSRGEFIEMLALAQVLPGPNVCNLALMIGDRYFGLRGAFAALAGMMVVPLLIVLAATFAYVHWAHVPQVAGALKGMGAVAAGLIIGTAIKLATALHDSPLRGPLCALLGGAAFAGVALLRWPLALVLLACAALALPLAYLRVVRR
jgi:chromate transporter